jgi:hypothetical protein
MRELVAHHKGDRNTHPHPPAMSAGSYPRTHALRPALTLTLAAPPGNALKTRGCSVLSARCLRRMFRGFCVRPPHASAAPSLCSPMSPRFAPRPPSLVPSPGHATGPLGRRVTPRQSLPFRGGPPRGLAASGICMLSAHITPHLTGLSDQWKRAAGPAPKAPFRSGSLVCRIGCAPFPPDQLPAFRSSRFFKACLLPLQAMRCVRPMTAFHPAPAS